MATANPAPEPVSEENINTVVTAPGGIIPTIADIAAGVATPKE